MYTHVCDRGVQAAMCLRNNLTIVSLKAEGKKNNEAIDFKIVGGVEFANPLV